MMQYYRMYGTNGRLASIGLLLMGLAGGGCASATTGGAATHTAKDGNAGGQSVGETDGTSSAATAVTVESGAGAAGQSGGEEPQPSDPEIVLGRFFDVLDCDREDAINTGQVDEHFTDMFAPFDIDRSRTLSVGEYANMSPRGPLRERRRILFATIDEDGDGEITVHQYQDHLNGMIDAADANRDGDVTRKELFSPSEPVSTGAPHAESL